MMAKQCIENAPDGIMATPEVHYNHYGDRGCVDLVIETIPQGNDLPFLTIYEFKSRSAVEIATGANEIIRQFNRHIEYFFKGSDYNERSYFGPTFLLLFEPEKSVFDHVFSNKDLYLSCTNRPDELTSVSSSVGFLTQERGIIHLDHAINHQDIHAALTEELNR